jgi:hypothetical protein
MFFVQLICQKFSIKKIIKEQRNSLMTLKNKELFDILEKSLIFLKYTDEREMNSYEKLLKKELLDLKILEKIEICIKNFNLKEVIDLLLRIIEKETIINIIKLLNCSENLIKILKNNKIKESLIKIQKNIETENITREFLDNWKRIINEGYLSLTRNF